MPGLPCPVIPQIKDCQNSLISVGIAFNNFQLYKIYGYGWIHSHPADFLNLGVRQGPQRLRDAPEMHEWLRENSVKTRNLNDVPRYPQRKDNPAANIAPSGNIDKTAKSDGGLEMCLVAQGVG